MPDPPPVTSATESAETLMLQSPLLHSCASRLCPLETSAADSQRIDAGLQQPVVHGRYDVGDGLDDDVEEDRALTGECFIHRLLELARGLHAPRNQAEAARNCACVLSAEVHGQRAARTARFLQRLDPSVAGVVEVEQDRR